MNFMKENKVGLDYLQYGLGRINGQMDHQKEVISKMVLAQNEYGNPSILITTHKRKHNRI